MKKMLLFLIFLMSAIFAYSASVPAKVTGVKVIEDYYNKDVIIKWNKVPNASSYKIYMYEVFVNQVKIIYGIKGTRYRIPNIYHYNYDYKDRKTIKFGRTYKVKVAAKNSHGYGPKSEGFRFRYKPRSEKKSTNYLKKALDSYDVYNKINMLRKSIDYNVKNYEAHFERAKAYFKIEKEIEANKSLKESLKTSDKELRKKIDHFMKKNRISLFN